MATPAKQPELDFLPIPGIRLGAAAAEIRYRGRNDLLLIELAEGATCAAVFTRNAFCAAPVVLARRHLAAAPTAFLMINSGNANAGTGDAGMHAAEESCRALAALRGCRPEQVLPFSTGVIGEPLPVNRLAAGLPAALTALSERGWADAARAIMTTDTVPKLVSRRVELDGRSLSVTGMAKGSGMIKPDMATMLAYIATDAAVPQALLQECLKQAVEPSFNAITVDGDTSTNDSFVLMATGRGEAVFDSVSAPGWEDMKAAVIDVARRLAQAIVRDGEGATKFIEIAVGGARSREEADIQASGKSIQEVRAEEEAALDAEAAAEFDVERLFDEEGQPRDEAPEA